MAANGLSVGVIKSMTRGAPVREPADGEVQRGSLPLHHKMELLNLAIQDPPENIGAFIQELRDGQGATDPFVWLREQYEGAPEE